MKPKNNKRTSDAKRKIEVAAAEATKDGPIDAAQVEQQENLSASASASEAGHASDPTIDVIEDPIVTLQANVDSLQNTLLRAKADYQNLQRRSAKEQAEAVRYANASLMKPLVQVLDDFERCLIANQQAKDAASVVDGVRLVYDNFFKALVDQGLERIESLHLPFDPHVHEAMMQQPSTEHPPGTVIEELAKGYRLRDRVIRPAKVLVSQATEPAAEVGSAEEDSHG